ncbi:MAG: elongation factor Ts [Gammaproteobacteria bacterium]|nr:elongation factor Ts [Gammaproteobacteria bacterium]
MQISATMVKELRERTGAGMMECKKALTENNGDMEVAIEWMRKQGMAKADKKAGRIAAEGIIATAMDASGKTAVLVEVNCETDFVGKGDDFIAFANKVAQLICSKKPADLDALLALTLDGATIEDVRRALIAKIGENIQVRRFVCLQSQGTLIGQYSHGGRIGVLVDLKGGDQGLAKDLAMHVAASRPVCVSETGVPKEALDKEREILIAQAQDSGKAHDIIEKMVEGRLKKYLAEITLVGQPFVKDPDQIVSKLLKTANAEVLSFYRLEVGEGIEKQEDNFVQEVMAQVKAS